MSVKSPHTTLSWLSTIFQKKKKKNCEKNHIFHIKLNMGYVLIMVNIIIYLIIFLISKNNNFQINVSDWMEKVTS